MTALWDSTGHQQVVEGKGEAIYRTRELSRSDTTQLTLFVEQGRYGNGLKQGIWTGHYDDGSYFYEETYDNGICQSSKAYSSVADTIRYSAVEQQPEFSGGVQGIREFMSKNLHYPKPARKLNAQGQVIVSFLVCADGTLCDYEVIKSVQANLDEEAIRAVRQMSGLWKPGIQRGQKVRVKYKLPVNFTLY